MDHKVQELDGPRRFGFEAAKPQRSNGHEGYTGRPLEIFMDVVQLFGAVSLFEAALEMQNIAKDIPLAHVASTLLFSFLIISNLQAVGSALEAFEGEYTKNWAVLGLNWTANFFGVSLFIIARFSRGDTRMPWQSMIAPTIQTIVLLYMLARVGGTVGRVRMFLVLGSAALAIGFAAFTKGDMGIELLCDDASVMSDDGFIFTYIPEDCWDVETLENSTGSIYADWQYSSMGDGEKLDLGIMLKDSRGDDESCSTCLFFLSNDPILHFSLKGNSQVAFIHIGLIGIVLVGGSFAALILRPHIENMPYQRILTAVIVCGWVVLYPMYELARDVPRLVSWFECLVGSIVNCEYKVRTNGMIELSAKQEGHEPYRFKWRKRNNEGSRVGLEAHSNVEESDPAM